jgi:DNA-directed RNA polymerase specialized sigma24 family protein
MSCQEDFSQDIDNRDKLKKVFKYLENIKQEHRDILVYRIWDDLSYKEISEIT